MTPTTFKTAGTACGKVILLGEHAVVYGVPALAVGIDRGASARVVPGDGASSRLRVLGWNVDVGEQDEASDLARAFAAVLRATREDPAWSGNRQASVVVEAKSDLPPGGGLGCSAALGVAVARSLDPAAAPGVLAGRAMAWERVFHGNPSGIDAAVSAAGGCILFEKSKGLDVVRMRAPLNLCVGHSGVSSSTKAMVEAVANLKAQKPGMVDDTFDAIRALVRNARWSLETGDKSALGRLMDANQNLLAKLGVSTPTLDRLCNLARDAGAHGAKLTGAGGGGCVVALVPSGPVADQVLAAWHGAGFQGFATRVAPADAPGFALTKEASP